MIYDEYPDRWQIYRLTQVIVDKIKKEQEEQPEEGEKGKQDWNQVTEFIQVLLSYEIYRKRHSNRNGILKF